MTDLARTWVRLDNASNIFLAARGEIDTKVFRISAELDEEIEPVVLQEALDRVYAQYPLFRAVLRRGVFWYYLQESTRHPVITPDDAPSVTHLYRFDSRELLFRVLYRGRRISLEIFHALTDGTGSLWFFQDLVTEYVGLRHPDEFGDGQRLAPGEVKQRFAVDAFTHWFRARTNAVPFVETAQPPESVAQIPEPVTSLPEPVTSLPEPVPSLPEPVEGRPSTGSGNFSTGARDPSTSSGNFSTSSGNRIRRGKVARVRGVHTPDLRTRVVELSMPTAPVLALARAEGVSLTIYLIAMFFAALRSTRPRRRREQTMTVSVPVNLRQFFPTDSGRNFFATTLLEHTETGDPEATELGEVCRDLDRQFQRLLTRASLERKMRRLVRFERHPLLRVVPRPLKDRLLDLINRFANRSITVAVSNLGRVTLPEPVRGHVGRLYFHVSAVRPQICVVSHGDQLCVSFTSPFVETDYHAAYVRQLTGQGVPVVVNATRVTPEELAEPLTADGSGR